MSGSIIRLKGCTSIIYCIAINSNSTILAAGSHDKNILLWNIYSETQIGKLEGHDSGVHNVTFDPTPDRDILASSSFDGIIRIWNVQTLTQISIIECHTSGCNFSHIIFSPILNSNILLSVETLIYPFFTSYIKFWDIISQKQIKTLSCDVKCISSPIAFDPKSDNSIIAFGSADSSVQIWNINTLEHIETLVNTIGRISSVTFKNNLLIYGSSTGDIMIWDIQAEFTLIKILNISDSEIHIGVDLVLNIIFVSDVDNSIKFLDLQTKNEIESSRITYTSKITKLSCSLDNRLIAACATDNTVLVIFNPYASTTGACTKSAIKYSKIGP